MTSDRIGILFVCHGNICRSPMAEYIMKHIVSSKGISDLFDIASCATSCEEIGNDVYLPARAVLEENGISCGHRAARRFTADDYRHYDNIIVMDRRNLSAIMRMTDGDPDGKVTMMMSELGRDADVADPWYTGSFDITYDVLTEACTALLGRLLPTSV